MIVSALRIYRIPTDCIELNYVECSEKMGQAECVYNWLTGKPTISSVVEPMFTPAFRGEIEAYLERKRYTTDRETVTIVCSNGTRELGKNVLRNTFSYIDDMLHEFPQESVVVPFTVEVLFKCLWGVGVGSPVPLVEVIEPLSFLNPKDNSYYFRYDTNGTSPATLLELARKLTEDDRAHIMTAWDLSHPSTSLPREGLGDCILTPILASYGDIANLEVLFPTHTSFIFSQLHDIDAIRVYLTTKVFDDNVCRVDSGMSMRVTTRVVDILADSKNAPDKESATRLLSMLSIHDPLFDYRSDEKKYGSCEVEDGVILYSDYRPLIVTPPFGLRLPALILGDKGRPDYRRDVCANLSRIFTLPEDVVLCRLDASLSRFQ